MYKKIIKIRFTRNAKISKPNKIFATKFDTKILKLASKLCQNLKSLSSELIDNLPVKERHGRAAYR